jgi:hypothetical protein
MKAPIKALLRLFLYSILFTSFGDVRTIVQFVIVIHFDHHLLHVFLCEEREE